MVILSLPKAGDPLNCSICPFCAAPQLPQIMCNTPLVTKILLSRMGFSQVSGDNKIIPRALLQSQLVQIKCTF